MHEDATTGTTGQDRAGDAGQRSCSRTPPPAGPRSAAPPGRPSGPPSRVPARSAGRPPPWPARGVETARESAARVAAGGLDRCAAGRPGRRGAGPGGAGRRRGAGARARAGRRRGAVRTPAAPPLAVGGGRSRRGRRGRSRRGARACSGSSGRTRPAPRSPTSWWPWSTPSPAGGSRPTGLTPGVPWRGCSASNGRFRTSRAPEPTACASRCRPSADRGSFPSYRRGACSWRAGPSARRVARLRSGRDAGPSCRRRVVGWRRGDSNPQPPPCKGGALPVELRPPEARGCGPRAQRRSGATPASAHRSRSACCAALRRRRPTAASAARARRRADRRTGPPGGGVERGGPGRT